MDHMTLDTSVHRKIKFTCIMAQLQIEPQTKNKRTYLCQDYRTSCLYDALKCNKLSFWIWKKKKRKEKKHRLSVWMIFYQQDSNSFQNLAEMHRSSGDRRWPAASIPPAHGALARLTGLDFYSKPSDRTTRYKILEKSCLCCHVHGFLLANWCEMLESAAPVDGRSPGWLTRQHLPCYIIYFHVHIRYFCPPWLHGVTVSVMSSEIEKLLPSISDQTVNSFGTPYPV